MKIILASASPRRRDLLESIGLSFEVRVSEVPEIRRRGEEVSDYVTRLARDKANAVGKDEPDAWIIAADTVVYLDGDILEKPGSAAEASEMLAKISGKTHTVYTAIALRHAGSEGLMDTTVTLTDVRMAPLSRDVIDWYVKTGEPMDKAGSYAVQGIGAMFIEAVFGSYTNVVGLPLSVLVDMMRTAGLEVWRAR
ncbi:MAG TPA: Maf family protein [Thermoanaerobaculia bacterium]|nr:Maf family protein [Thermoanaerobaculia bacterium]